MKTIRNFMGLALIITFAITFLFNISCYEESSNKVIIGGLFSITGNGETLGKASRAALEIAIEDINEFYKGNEKNVKFASSVKDTVLEPNLALELLMEFFDSGTKLVIGPMSSAEVWAIKDFANDNDIIIVSQSSTAGKLSLPDDNIFRFAPDDALEGEAITALLLRDKIVSIIPIYRDDDGNEGVILATETAFNKAEVVMGTFHEGFKYDPDTVALDEGDPGARDFTDIVEDLHGKVQAQLALDNLNTKNVAVLLAGFDEVVQIFRLATSQEKYEGSLGAVKWYGTDGIALSEVLLEDVEASEFAEDRTYPSPTLGLDDDDMKRIWGPIAEEITKRTGVVPYAFALSVYDIAWTLAEAYLNTKDPKDPDYSFGAFKDAFISAADVNGITGSTKLNVNGDRKSANFDFWGVRDEEEDGMFIWKKVVFFDAAKDPGGQITEFE